MPMSGSPSFALSLFASLSLSVPLLSQSPPAAPDPAAALAARRAALHDAGVRAPLSVYPVAVLGKPSPQVADALGLVLEGSGMPDVEAATNAFEVPAGTAWESVPDLFAAHVRKAVPAGEPARHHLYAEFVGTPRTGPEEVRFVVLDAAGELVFADRQTKADADFRRIAQKDPDPLGCATLVGERLFTLAGWTKAPGSVNDGKFAARWRDRSGAPDKKELAAMQRRCATLRADWRKARVVVLPIRAMGKHDTDGSVRLAASLQQELGGTVAAAADGARLETGNDSNEQKRLWDLARGLRAALEKQPLAADYAVAVDFALDAARGAGFAHVVVCTGKGEWVLADFQNDQHPLWQRLAPKTPEDCERLVLARCRDLLR